MKEDNISYVLSEAFFFGCFWLLMIYRKKILEIDAILYFSIIYEKISFVFKEKVLWQNTRN